MTREKEAAAAAREVPELSPRVKEYFALDNAARSWWNTAGHPRYERQEAFVSREIDARGKRVLDIATGRGRFAIAYARGGAAHVTAVDISNGMLEVARESARDAGVEGLISFQRCDFEESDFDQEAFDVVNCMEVYVHFPNPRHVTRKIFDCLAPGGFLVANVDLPVTGRWYFGWVNQPLRSALSLPAVYNLSLFAYFRLLPAALRRALHRRFNLPLEWHNPISLRPGSGKKRLDTAEESIAFLAGAPRSVLSRPKDAIHLMPLEEFTAMFREAGFEITRVLREGRPWQLPYGCIVVARKPAAPRDGGRR